MIIKLLLLICFFGLMIGVGFWSAKRNRDVNDYVLGGRNVGPWLTAFGPGQTYPDHDPEAGRQDNAGILR